MPVSRVRKNRGKGKGAKERAARRRNAIIRARERAKQVLSGDAPRRPQTWVDRTIMGFLNGVTR